VFKILNGIPEEIPVPNMGVGHCLGPEGMESAWGKGAREGPAPQEARKMSSQCSARTGTTWARQGGPGKSDLMKKDRREQSEGFFFTRQEDHVINVIMIAESILILCVCFRRINHMALKPFALILCLVAAVHHLGNNISTV
jgi:hypothetical protein